jgi:sigma-B regulation protein RsbU (phosphoserine phosphatase)
MLIPLLTVLLTALCAYLVYLYKHRKWRLEMETLKASGERERAVVLEFMHGLAKTVGDGVSTSDLLKHVAHSTLVSTGAMSACVYQVDGGELEAVAVEGLFPPQMPLPKDFDYLASTRTRFIESVLHSERIPIGRGIIGEVAKTGEGELLRDASCDTRVAHVDDPSLVLHCMIAVPIRFQETLLAVLAVANTMDGRPFTKSDYAIAQGIAEQAGLAIHNLELIQAQIAKNKIDTDLSLASSIQSMLLPKKMPQVPQIDIAALYLPAQKIGGDLYDVFQIDDNRFGVAVADVSGKGIPASLLMAICQSNLRHLAKSGISPARVLSDLNAIMREEMRRDMFVTMIYGIVDVAEETLTLSRAGHELPLVLRKMADGSFKTEFIQCDGMALGMAKERLFDALIQEKTMPFGKDEILVLYTDGITEAANPHGEQYGSTRLSDSILDLREMSADTINERVFDRVVQFSAGCGQADDVTMLTIKRR